MTQQNHKNNTFNPEFEALLDFLRQNRGFDFTGYKRASLERRVRRRMQEVGAERYSDYTAYLEARPDEFIQLFNTILINVTSFFRDTDAWAYLREQIVPRMLAQKRPDDPIRIWSAGCASGEEAYTLAMIMAEALGPNQFRDQVKIYATDVDEDALGKARLGSYTAKEMAHVPPDLAEKYFERAGERYVFRKEFRRSIIFGRHDLLLDAPISRVDLLVCRNTLMYFNRETQTKILARFFFALNDGGYLFLGKAEMLLTHANLFAPTEVKQRVFMKAHKAGRDQLLLTAQGVREETINHLLTHVRLRESAFELDPVAQLVVDADGTVILTNERLRAMLGLTLNDTGRPLQDLELSYHPVELRSLLDKARTQRRPVGIQEIRWAIRPDDVRWLDVDAIPLGDASGSFLGTKVLFRDVTATRRLREELELSRHELETVNEELQSTNEELETTNEELQSTNEELETMNEELQSTNEELDTVNNELRQNMLEIDRINNFLGSILRNPRIGVAVLDPQFTIQVWNDYMEELWGLRADRTVGKNFLALDIGLPAGELRETLQACLSGHLENREVTLRAADRRGQPVECKTSVAVLQGMQRAIEGVIVLIDAIPVSRLQTPSEGGAAPAGGGEA